MRMKVLRHSNRHDAQETATSPGLAATLLVAGLILAGSPGEASEPGSSLEPRSRLEVGVAEGLPGARVEVPVRVFDMPGTPLSSDRADDQRVRGIAFRVQWRPTDALTCHTVRRAGSTLHLDPVFETSPTTAGSVAWLASFPAGGVDFVRPEPELSATASRTVAMIDCTISADVRPGTKISLRLDPRVSVLSNAQGTIEESVGKQTLRLGHGQVTVVGPGFSGDRP